MIKITGKNTWTPGESRSSKSAPGQAGIYVELRSQPKQPEGPLKGFFCAARLNRRRTQLCHWQRMSIHPARGLSGVLQHMWEQFRLLFFSRTSYACGREISEQQASEIWCDFIFSPHICSFHCFSNRVSHLSLMLLLLLLNSVKVIQHEVSKQLLSAGLLKKNAAKSQHNVVVWHVTVVQLFLLLNSPVFLNPEVKMKTKPTLLTVFIHVSGPIAISQSMLLKRKYFFINPLLKCNTLLITTQFINFWRDKAGYRLFCSSYTKTKKL